MRGAARIRLAASRVRSPAAAVLLARMFGWAVVLPVLKRTVPLERLVAIAAAPALDRRPQRPEEIAGLARLAHRLSALGLRDNCLERSLVAFRYLGAAGARPTLVVGARRGATDVEGHVWVEVDGRPVDVRDRDVSTYVVVSRHGTGNGSSGPHP